jgi:pimeloyl-ACP methyl ester carboxylesterase
MTSAWISQDILINGMRLHYVRTGAGSGKPQLVLAHGFSDNGLCWEQTASELDTEYDVILPDARGHGLSARVQPGEKVDMASDLAGLIQTLELDHPVVGGHSMGAAVSAQMAARFPDLLSALLLEDPPWFPIRAPEARSAESRPAGPHPMSAFVKSLEGKTAEQLMAECRAEHPTWAVGTVRRWCEGKKQLDANILAIDGELWLPWPGVVRAIACPTLLITATPELGGIIGSEVERQVTEMNPNIRMANVPGVGHHIRFGDHANYMKSVWAFLKSL